MQKLHSMFSQEQVTLLLCKTIQSIQFNKLNDTGYVSLTPRQLDFLYGPDSPYNDTEALTRFQNLTEQDHHEAIQHTIKALAREEIAFKAQRKKDIVLSPILLSPLINAAQVASQVGFNNF